MSYPHINHDGYNAEGYSYSQGQPVNSYPQQGYYGQQEYTNSHQASPPYTHPSHYGSAHRLAVPINAQNSTPPSYEAPQQHGENASYYNQGPESEQADGAKGIGSTVTGGAAGGYAAHQMGGGKLATAGGALLGAVGMNMATHKFKQDHAQPAQKPAHTVVVVPAQTGAPVGGLGGGLGLGSRMDMGGGIGMGRVQRRLARRGIGMY